MLKIFDKIIFLTGIFAMLGLIGAYLSSYIDPNLFVFPSLLGLAYPYLLIINVVLFLYWLVRWKKIAWAELLILLAGIPAFRTYYGIAGKEQVTAKGELTLLSYNVRYFDAYGWSQQKDTREKMLDYLNHFQGDLLCLQEFSLPNRENQEQLIKNKLKSFPYHHIYRDMAIFSRLPLLRKEHLSSEKGCLSAPCIYCDLILKQDTIRLYCIHLESYRLGKAERALIQGISKGVKSDNFSGGLKKLSGRLAKANKNRARQAGKIKNHILHSPYPVIVCGDFNDTPLSYTYREIKNGLQDSFIEKGRGLGNTYIGEFPSFRIDYILHTPHIETVKYNRENIRFSDHYPIKSNLRLKRKTTE